MHKKVAVILSLAVGLSGCLMGPNYKKPELALPDSQEVNLSVFMRDKWWEMFADPVLNKLEEEALADNKDLVAAMAKVDQARAQVGIVGADQLPTLGATGSAERQQNKALAGDVNSYAAYTAGLAVSYELDLWGKYRRLSEAARAQLLSTESQRDAVRLALTADVARYYFGMATLDAQLSISKKTLQSREETLKIYRSRYKNGYSTELDLKRVEAEKASVQASVSEYERQLSQSETALAVLLGRSPRDIVRPSVERGKTLTEIAVIPEIPSEVPADLLTRRPDVRAAEGQLIAANANIGAARAAYFPSISLTAAGGFASNELNTLISPSTAIWNAAGSLAAPIFSGGKIKATNKQAEAVYKELLASYEKAAQSAYKDTYDSLVDNQKYRNVVTATNIQKEALARSLELAQKQKDAGLIGMLDLLDVERNLLSAEIALSTARRNQLNALVGVSQALGGGWTEDKGFPTPEDAAYAQEAETSEAAKAEVKADVKKEAAEVKDTKAATVKTDTKANKTK